MNQDGKVAEPFGDDLDEATSILLLTPTMDATGDEGCSRLLGRRPVDQQDVVCVTFTDSPDDRMDAWGAHLDAEPAKIGFIDAGDPARSATGANGSVQCLGRSIRIEYVTSPGDLTGLGMKITELLSEWQEDGNGTVLCFHTLTSLLQFVDLQRAFRFLHVLIGRLGAMGAVGHFHMDPSAHEDREVNTLKTLFDAVVEFEDGEWVVRRR